MEPYFRWIEDGEFFPRCLQIVLPAMHWTWQRDAHYVHLLKYEKCVLWKESRKIALDISRNELWTTETKLYIWYTCTRVALKN